MSTSRYNSPDYYQVDELFTDEHKLIKQAVRDWVNKEVIPIIDEANQKSEFPVHFVKELGEIGAFGPFIPVEYGGSGMDLVSYGLIMQELERGDSSVRSMASVQSSLVMYLIFHYGTEEQKRKYLPKLATGEMLGAFGLTEPDYGSDPGGMVSHFIDKGDHYLLNGSKMWITNAPVSDISIVWAKDEEGIVRGLILESGMEGYTRPETLRKWSLHASSTGESAFY